MSRIGTLLLYKIRFFFGPALRGRFGPLAYIALILVFVPSGYGLGVALGEGVKSGGVGTLSAPLSALLALGFLYSYFQGVTAHVSEFDFFMTADLRPREFLIADLVFQFFSLFGAGGLAAIVAGYGIVVTLGRPAITIVPLILCLFSFALVVLMVIQVGVVLAVRYPKAHVRAGLMALFFLSLLPAASLAFPGFPIRFGNVPIPTTAFGSLGYDLLMGRAVDPVSLVVAVATVVGVAGLWVAVSDTYIFHGIHPSLSAGFGQVDMAARAAQQRRMTAGFGKYTTGITVRTDRGGDTSYMARYHLLRIIRDGSIAFIGLFALISLMPVQFTGGAAPGQSAPVSILATQMLTFLVAVLALNWSYYERENLWIVVAAAASPAAYFRGLLVSFATVGLVIAGLFTGFVVLTTPGVSVSDVAVPIAAAVAAALVSTALLTRLKVQPAAFSFAMIAVLMGAVISGYLGGFAASAVVLMAEMALGLGAAAQLALLLLYCVGLAGLGLWWVSRLASGFRL